MHTLQSGSASGRRGPAWLRGSAWLHGWVSLRGRVSLRGSVSLRWSVSLRAAATSIALFALLGVGHVLPALHFALVAHRICAEHGELLHEAALEPSVEAGSRSSVPELVSGQHAGHEHDHCGVLALPGSFGAAPSAAWREPSAPSQAVSCASAGERPAQGGIALLLRAPKLAPPA